MFEDLMDIHVLELRKKETPLNKGPGGFQRAKRRKKQHADIVQLKNIKKKILKPCRKRKITNQGAAIIMT